MDLRSDYPFWLLDKGIIHSYPSLNEDVETDVAIMGAGISGALAAWHLCKAGLKVVVLDKRHVGMGSTAASTALLQYEIDTPLTELSKMVGEESAAKSYLLCRQAIFDLEKICSGLPEAGYTKRPSLQYASFKKDVPDLKNEYEARKNIGIPLKWMDKEEVESKFGFTKEAALFSRDGAEVKAYALTHALLYRHRRRIQVYDHTEVVSFNENKKGVELLTDSGKKIKARKLIIASGYESAKYIPWKINTLQSTYAIVSEPFTNNHFWHRNALIWETARPYLYLRTTPDNRILIGGKDDDFSNPRKRDASLARKARELEHSFKQLFASIDFKTDFKWAGTFASTKDGLPYIGSLPGKPHTYFSLGFGGNGITFSVLAAQIITNLVTGRKDENAGLFSFTR